MTALALLPILKRIWFVPVIGALLLYALIERGNARHWHKLYDGEKAAHTADIVSWKAASAEAVRRAQDEKSAQEARQAQIKDKADETLTKARDDARSAAERYAAAHGVQCPTANNQRGAGGSNLPQDAGSPQVADRPGSDAVVLTRRDYDILIDNTTRLKNAHDWSEALR